MRESYRLSKYPIIEECNRSGVSFDIVFLYVGHQPGSLEKETLQGVRSGMEKAMKTIVRERGVSW